jgi:hypothetical protein
MSTFIITYDLRQPGRNYDDLIDKIKTYNSACKPTKSTWIIKSNDEPSYIRDTLLKYMDNNDRLFVASLTGYAAWTNTISSSEKIKSAFT